MTGKQQISYQSHDYRELLSIKNRNKIDSLMRKQNVVRNKTIGNFYSINH